MATKIKLGNGNWGVKDGGTLAYNDENGVFKAIELASSRASGATYVTQSGLIADAEVGVPRIDWTNGVGELLLEPQSTNLVTNSNEGNINAGGAPTSITNEIAPDGTNTGVIPTPSLTTNRFQETILGGSYPTNTKVTYTYYRKRISTPVGVYDGDVDIKALVNCTQVGSTTQVVSDINGYDRFQAVFNITDGSLDAIIRLYYGNVVGVGNSSVSYWGHQLEPLSYPTSYIPTSGSTATRIADAVTGNSSLGQVINSSEGVLYAEMSWFEDAPSALQRISISDGTTSQRILLYKSTSANTISAIVTSGSNVLSTNYNYSVLSKSAGDIFKLAIKWKQNDFAFWVDGNEVGTSSSGSAPVGLNKLALESSTTGGNYYGRIRDLRVYDTALTDAQLQSLTTL